MKLLGRPKKFPENGRSVLSNAEVWVGTCRPSKSRLAIIVIFKNVCWPMMG